MHLVSSNTESAESRNARLLRKAPLFSQLDDSLTNALAARSVLMEVERRRRIDAHHNALQAVYLIVSGRVRLARQASAERQVTLGYYGPGELVGERNLTLHDERTELVAVESSTILQIEVEQLEAAFAQDAALAACFAKLLGERRVAAEQRLESFLTRSVESRVAEFLVEMESKYGVTQAQGSLINARFTHQEIASFVGSTRETVTVVLAEFRRRNWIDIVNRRVIVLDKARLQVA